VWSNRVSWSIDPGVAKARSLRERFCSVSTSFDLFGEAQKKDLAQSRRAAEKIINLKGFFSRLPEAEKT
jgi:hypothetical protein